MIFYNLVHISTFDDTELSLVIIERSVGDCGGVESARKDNFTVTKSCPSDGRFQ